MATRKIKRVMTLVWDCGGSMVSSLIERDPRTSEQARESAPRGAQDTSA
jgi:hypothetical protein